MLPGRLRVAWATAVALSATTALVSGAVFVVAQAFESDPAPAAASAPAPSPGTTTPVAVTPAWRQISVRPVAVRRVGSNPKAVVVSFRLPAGTTCARRPRAIVLAETPRRVSFGVRVDVADAGCSGRVRSELTVAAGAALAGRAVVVNAVSWAPEPRGYRRCGPAGCPTPR